MVVLLLLIHCLLLPHCFVGGGGILDSCFFVYNLVSFLILQSSHWGERAGCFTLFALNAICLLVFLVCSSLCYGLVSQCVIMAFPGRNHSLLHVILLRSNLKIPTVRSIRRALL